MRALGRCGRKRRKNRRSKTKENVISQSHDATFINLQRWMEEMKDAKNRKRDQHLQPCDFPDTGRGLRTLRRIKTGDCIVSVPRKLLITTDTVFNHVIGSELVKHGCVFTPQQVISLFLAIESVRGNDSKWSPYIQSLPRVYSTPLYFSTREVTFLTGRARCMAETLRARFSTACVEMTSFVRQAFPSINGLVTREVLQWTWSTVDTRSVYLETRPHASLILSPEESNVALAPFLDMLNHNDTSQISAGLNPVSNCYEITTHDMYDKFQQVFISYGPHDNTKLLVNYGFTLPCNDHNCYIWSTDDVKTCFPGILHWDRKVSLLREYQLHKSLVCTNDGPTWSLLTALKIITLSWEQLSLCKRLLQGLSVTEENDNTAKQMTHTLIRETLFDARRHVKLVESQPVTVHKNLIMRLAVDDVDVLENSLKVLALMK